jgi:ribosomal protein S18 acetylase RimI-like enzyme
MTCDIRITQLDARSLRARTSDLGALLHACVLDGASIGFILPFTAAEADDFWRLKVLPGVEQGTRIVLLAEEAGSVIGTVQLDYDTPGNQRHRAEVRKLLVHPDWRRRGIGKVLMHAIEAHASRLGRSLITLDTRTGDAAEPLYTALGYRVAGVIPDYCRDTIVDRLDSTTVMYKSL